MVHRPNVVYMQTCNYVHLKLEVTDSLTKQYIYKKRIQ